MQPEIQFHLNTPEEEQKVVNRFFDSKDFFEKMEIVHFFPNEPIESEYDQGQLQTFLDSLAERWETEEKNFLKQLLDFFRFTPTQPVTVHLSQYGPLGFYENEHFSVTVNRHSHLDPLKIIKHEIIHLLVEDFVKKHNLDHTQKEHIVETIGNLFEELPDKATGIQTG